MARHPRMSAAEAETREQCRRLLADLEDFKVGFPDLRRFLLAEAGAVLIESKTRRRLRPVYDPKTRSHVNERRTERLDLIEYRRPGGPARPSYWLIRWADGWDERSLLTLAEAREEFDNWSTVPAWLRAPLLLEVSDALSVGNIDRADP